MKRAAKKKQVQASKNARRRPGRGGPPDQGAPDPEVSASPTRRVFTAAYKRRMVEEADKALESGESGALGALLRQEGLYSSHLTTWRQQREAGELAGLEPKKRGRKPKQKSANMDEFERLKRENARLSARLQQAETIIDVQKKVSRLLGVNLPQSDDEGES